MGGSKEGQGLCPWTPLGSGDPRPHELETTHRTRYAPSNSWGLGSPDPSGGSGAKPLTFLASPDQAFPS